MNGRRVSVLLRGDAEHAVCGAVAAERLGIDGVWIGDLTEEDPVDDYVMTTLSAVAAVTRHVRLGAVLRLHEDRALFHAEDIGVVDQASAGRLEVALRPWPDVESWEALATRVLGAWTNWPLPGGGQAAVTPRPAQPWLPRLVVGAEHADVAARLGAGLLLHDLQTASARPSMMRRTVAAVRLSAGQAPLREQFTDVVHALGELRSQLDHVAADEVVIEGADTGEIESDFHFLSTVLAPCLRCTPSDVEWLAPDALNWFDTTTADKMETR